MRLQMHATDADRLEPLLGSARSKGCIRIPASLNRLLDHFGLLDADYTISNQLQAESLVWSPCGVDVNLRTNSSMRLSTVANREAMATVDSQDVNAAIVYHLQWRVCR